MTHLSEAILRNTRGVSLTLGDPTICALLRDRVDFFVYDAVAAPIDNASLAALIAASGDTPFLVRTHADTYAIQSYLNMGVDGLVLTGIHFAAEAERAVAAALYPPEGIRPYVACAGTRFASAHDVSLETLNDQITLVIEMAHPQSAAQANDIAEVTGVDGFLINAEKLAVSMERGLDVTHTDVQQAVAQIARAAASFELPLGVDAGLECTLPADAPLSFQIMARDTDMLRAAAMSFFPNTDDSVATNQNEPAGLRAMR